MDTLTRFAEKKLTAIAKRNLRRALHPTERLPPIVAERDGRKLISFACNDYLGLSQHARVKQAAVQAIGRYGAGAGASRLVTGNNPLYGELEATLARIKGTEAALVFGSGYLANIGIIPTLIGKRDLIVGDELMHACMHAGARLSGAKTVLFDHNDVADCRARLAAHRAAHPKCLVMTEGVFSMDGDRAPVKALARLAEEFDAWLMTDDAHALGVIGGGRGSAFADGGAEDEKIDVPLQMGTLSKAAGAYGGYLCASAPVIDFIANRARSLFYSTALPPAVLASATEALKMIEEDRDLVARPLAKARLFTERMGLIAAQSAIVPMIVGDPQKALIAAGALEDEGFLVIAIRPPTVPEGTSRLRFTFSAAHTDGDIERLAEALGRIGPRIGLRG
ncbi:MAG: 8-amino-7-oxononanoate synthase [Proteobacteria bacterium]|nr:8-amino-7-oxononanoate synthase [Pseudomonadota bacterium]